MTKHPDVVALDAARDALWGDEDEDPRPSPEGVGGKVAKLMEEHNLSFQEACALLVQRKKDVDVAEAQLNAARSRFR